MLSIEFFLFFKYFLNIFLLGWVSEVKIQRLKFQRFKNRVFRNLTVSQKNIPKSRDFQEELRLLVVPHLVRFELSQSKLSNDPRLPSLLREFLRDLDSSNPPCGARRAR